jgi:hypothetical protein
MLKKNSVRDFLSSSSHFLNPRKLHLRRSCTLLKARCSFQGFEVFMLSSGYQDGMFGGTHFEGIGKWAEFQGNGIHVMIKVADEATEDRTL